MDLDRLQARIRPRRPWEAVDLGFSLVWSWRGVLYPPWLAACLPVLLLVAALGYRYPLVACLVLWWLKPLLDRVILHTLSLALFGETPAWREVFRELPRLWGRGLTGALFIHRFQLARSYTMPVDLLEGLRGQARRTRQRLLGRRHKEEAVRLTLTCALAELSLIVSLVAVAAFLLPSRVLAEPFAEAFEGLFTDQPGGDLILLDYLWLAAQMTSILFLEPFYVAGGLCLYLNRRTQLEAWDVEMAFRRLGARLKGVARTAVVAPLLLLLPFIMWPGPAAFATSVGPEPATADGVREPEEDGVSFSTREPQPCLEPGCREAHRAIAEVLSDPIFGSTKRVTRWRLRPGRPAAASSDRPWMARLGSALGAALEPVLWTAALVCLLTFILTRRHTGGVVSSLTGIREDRPESVLGLDLRRARLPGDIPTEARRLLELGRSAEAIGLLLRGALACLCTRDGLSLRRSMTEGECVSMIRRFAPGDRADYFQSLASAWTAAAYGHRPFTSGEVEVLIAGWSPHFEASA